MLTIEASAEKDERKSREISLVGDIEIDFGARQKMVDEFCHFYSGRRLKPTTKIKLKLN
jgi:hypothetical protein